MDPEVSTIFVRIVLPILAFTKNILTQNRKHSAEDKQTDLRKYLENNGTCRLHEGTVDHWNIPQQNNGPTCPTTKGACNRVIPHEHVDLRNQCIIAMMASNKTEGGRRGRTAPKSNPGNRSRTSDLEISVAAIYSLPLCQLSYTRIVL